MSSVGSPAGRHLKPGSRVEVRRRFDGEWSRGFEIAEVGPSGYRVLRLSDRSLLPVEFAFEEIRRERRQGLWWY